MLRRLLLAPCLAAGLAVASACGPSLPAGPVEVYDPVGSRPVPLPNLEDSLKFAVLGDFGDGSTGQYQLADQMAETHTSFPFELVLTVGDNIYGSERPQDFAVKFERPYAALLERDVKFYASLGNHDSREQRYYEPFNMGGELYYTFKAPAQNVRFFALESTYPEPEQIAWLEQALRDSTDDWKIVYFHHPLYSSAGRHGSDEDLRTVLEPLFMRYNVSVVFNGHDHVYERIEPQNGISYFVAGSGGRLRPGDLAGADGFRASGFDQDLVFLVAEIHGDELTFHAITRMGQIIDSGVIRRRIVPEGGGR